MKAGGQNLHDIALSQWSNFTLKSFISAHPNGLLSSALISFLPWSSSTNDMQPLDSSSAVGKQLTFTSTFDQK